MDFSNNPYLTIKERMELLQRWLIVHSIIYYRLGTSAISDRKFDNNAYALVEMAQKYSEVCKKTKYYYCMFDFDGSTGFDLPGRLNRLDSAKLNRDAINVVRSLKNG